MGYFATFLWSFVLAITSRLGFSEQQQAFKYDNKKQGKDTRIPVPQPGPTIVSVTIRIQ